MRERDDSLLVMIVMIKIQSHVSLILFSKERLDIYIHKDEAKDCYHSI